MKPPFRLAITDTTTQASWERRVDVLPAMLGRGSGSTVVFAHATISKRHAELVLEGDELVLLDQASHNGTLVRQRSERVKGRVRLRDVGFSFSIGVFDVRVAPIVTRGATVVLPVAAEPRDATKPCPDAIQASVRLDGAALSAELNPLVERYRNAFSDLFLGVSEGVAGLEPRHRAKWLRNFLAQQDELAHEPMMRDLLTSLEAPTEGSAAGPPATGATTVAERGGQRAPVGGKTMLELPAVGRKATCVLEDGVLGAQAVVDGRVESAKGRP